jgi:hypothetical protein
MYYVERQAVEDVAGLLKLCHGACGTVGAVVTWAPQILDGSVVRVGDLYCFYYYCYYYNYYYYYYCN